LLRHHFYHSHHLLLRLLLRVLIHAVKAG
jgi:hypothetical protein